MATSHEQRAQRERRIAQLRREIERAQVALKSEDPGVKLGAERTIARAGAELARLGAPPAPS
jgi:transcription elongation GreA/GreB family factor